MVLTRTERRTALAHVVTNVFMLDDADNPLSLALTKAFLMDIYDILVMPFHDIERLDYVDAQGNEILLPSGYQYMLRIIKHYDSYRTADGDPIGDAWTTVTADQYDDYRLSADYAGVAVTTQYARMPMRTPVLKKRYKPPNPDLNVHRHDEPVAADPVYSDTSAINGGKTAAQIFVGTTPELNCTMKCGKDCVPKFVVDLASPRSLTTTRPVASTVRPSPGIDATSKSIVDSLLVSHANPLPPILMFFYGSKDFGDYSLSLDNGEDFGDPKVNYSVITQHDRELDNDGEIVMKLFAVIAADNPSVCTSLFVPHATLVPEYLKEFIRVETIYAGMLHDNVVRDLAKANAVMGTENLDMVKVCFFPCTFAGSLFVSYTDWPRDLDAIFALPLMWVVRLRLQADGD